jgi:hypothetical protein
MVVRGFPARRPACAMDRQARLIILGIKQLVLLLMSDDCLRRVWLIRVWPGECRLTESTAATQPWRRELVFMPHTRHWLNSTCKSDAG